MNDKCAGGIDRNVGSVNKLEGLKVNLPQEPMITGGLRAAVFAPDGAGKKNANKVL